MDISEYQKRAHETAVYGPIGKDYVYPVLGLAGEAGEIANKIKKIFRDDGGEITPERKEELKKELGDVLWYVAELSTQLNLPLDEIAVFNLKRLHSRKERGVIRGGGDNR